MVMTTVIWPWPYGHEHGDMAMASGKWYVASGHGKWRVASGKWPWSVGVESGKWQVTSGKWQMTIGQWRVATVSSQGECTFFTYQ